MINQEAKLAHIKKNVDKINNLIQEGFLVLVQGDPDEQPYPLERPLEFINKETGLTLQYRISSRSVYTWYEHREDYDHGYDWDIEEVNKRLFERIKVYNPVPINWND